MAENDKRSRLVEAANELFYQHTFGKTTLAEIAKSSDVPLGNVYYYFKTKDTILEAVIANREKQMDQQFASFEASADIMGRVKAFVDYYTQISETTAKYGCIFGSLAQELSRTSGRLAELSSILVTKTSNWLTTQFQALGKNEDQAMLLAEQLIASIQGIALLTLTFKDPSLTAEHSKTIYKWLDAA